MIGVYSRTDRGTCIVVREANGIVQFIPMDASGLSLCKKNAESFLEEWSQIDYAVDRAAQCYLNSFLPKSEVVENILKELTMSEKKTTAKKATAAAKPEAKKATAAAKPESKKEKLEREAAEKKAKGEAKKAGKTAAPKGEKAGRKKVDISGKKIKLIKGTTRKFNEGSVRAMCFAAIKDGMTVADYIKATKSICDEGAALACLNKFANPSKAEKVADLV